MTYRKLRLFFSFYVSTLAIYACTGLIALLLQPSSFVVIVCFFGLFLSFIYKETFRKEDYYFYYNNHITRLQLYLFCLLANAIISPVILLFYYEIFA